MPHELDAIAMTTMLAGALVFATPETRLVGALLVAGGAYGLILPQFVEPERLTANRS